MAVENQLRVNLGKPIHNMNAHECLYVHQGTKQKALTVSFKRTIHVPDDGTTYQLPPNLGNFPLYNAAHYKETLPESMVLKGGCFMPVHEEREALWIRFESTRTFAIKVFLGGINAISGEPIMETFATALRRDRLINEEKSIQDYAVIDPADKGQLWLDGVAKLNGKVMQFVAVPSGSGYSVEAQINNLDAVGGIQIMVTPIKRGPRVQILVDRLSSSIPISIQIPLNATVYELLTIVAVRIKKPVEQLGILFKNRRLEQNRLLSSYDIEAKSHVHLVLNIQGGGVLNMHNPSNSEMAVGVGGLIKQAILRDPHPSTAWDSDNTAIFNLQLLNATVFQRVTGMAPPPSPVTAETYAAAGLPFFSIPSEVESGVKGIFGDVRSVGEIDQEKERKGLDQELKFPVIELDKTGQRVVFRGVEDLVKEVKGWHIAQNF